MKISTLIGFLIWLLPLSMSGQIDFEKYFKACNVEGSITIYDYKNKKWTYSDEADAKIATLPASTFKILNSMIALETGVIKMKMWCSNGMVKNGTLMLGMQTRI